MILLNLVFLRLPISGMLVRVCFLMSTRICSMENLSSEASWSYSDLMNNMCPTSITLGHLSLSTLCYSSIGLVKFVTLILNTGSRTESPWYVQCATHALLVISHKFIFLKFRNPHRLGIQSPFALEEQTIPYGANMVCGFCFCAANELRMVLTLFKMYEYNKQIEIKRREKNMKQKLYVPHKDKILTI